MIDPSPLLRTVTGTRTDFWNDSCSPTELAYALAHGAVGATTNPTIVLNVLRREYALWSERLQAIIARNATWGEVEVAWQLIEEMATTGAEVLLPVFRRERGLKGRLSIQTNPQNYRNAPALLDQALHFDRLAPNMQVKIPATWAGLLAIEEATYRGVSINATVCFTVPQALAVAEAVERGLRRRAAEELDAAHLTPVCTLMIGRLDDWLKAVAKRDGILTRPGTLDWAGIATLKKAYALYQERGYCTRLLAAAYRHHLHWSELIGGDIVLTIPHEWQLLFNASNVEVVERFDNPVEPAIVDELYRSFADFRAAYDAEGLPAQAFDGYGATVRTLRTFIAAYQELLAVVRDAMLPDPDARR